MSNPSPRPGRSPVIERIVHSRRAAVVLAGVILVQLALSVRFFFKYSSLPLALFVGYVVVALAAWLVVLRSGWLMVLMTRLWTFLLANVVLLFMVLVAYPRADALRAVGRGSDQDDCVRLMVSNVFSLRHPYAVGYFGDPCSSGPGEFFVYFPVQIFRSYFVVVPVLAVLLGYWVLRQVTDPQAAILLSLTQFASWLFLEMSAVGSDLIIIGWLFAAAVVSSNQGLRRSSRLLTVIGIACYTVFAGSRVPLIVVTAGSLCLLLVARGRPAWRIVAPVAVVTTMLYLGTYLAAPDKFRPGHLLGRDLIRHLGGQDQTIAMAALAAALAAAALVCFVSNAGRRFLRRHYYAANLALIALPMAASAEGDLVRRSFSLGAWEGLQYLFLAVPCILVATAHWLGLDAVRARRATAKGSGLGPSRRPGLSLIALALACCTFIPPMHAHAFARLKQTTFLVSRGLVVRCDATTLVSRMGAVGVRKPGGRRTVENTMPAFLAAIRLGADRLETDMRLTREGSIVLMHDPTVDRTTNGHGRVSEMRLTQIEHLRTADGSRVPTLRRFVESTRNSGVSYQLEFKTRPSKATLRRVMRIVEHAVVTDRVMFAASEAGTLRAAKRLMPTVTTGLIDRQRSEIAPDRIPGYVDMVNVHEAAATGAYVEQVEATGKGVSARAANSGPEWARLLDRDADDEVVAQIVTDNVAGYVSWCRSTRH